MALSSRISREEGFTLFELLIAMMLIAIGVMALLGTFDYSRGTSATAEAQDAAAQVGEREVERIASLGYGAIALGSTPSSSLDPANPDYWVSNSSPATYRWDVTSGSSATEPLVVAGGGGVSNDGGSWGDSRLGGRLYDFVTWVDDPCSACSSSSDRAITSDYKRITVAVTANADRLKKPVYVSTIVTDPQAVKGP